MTKDQTRAAAQIMLVWAEGRAIEFRDRNRSDCSTNWRSPLPSDEIMAWNWESYDYRLKSEPREWWVSVDQCDRAVGVYIDPYPGLKLVKVREVLE